MSGWDFRNSLFRDLDHVRSIDRQLRQTQRIYEEITVMSRPASELLQTVEVKASRNQGLIDQLQPSVSDALIASKQLSSLIGGFGSDYLLELERWQQTLPIYEASHQLLKAALDPLPSLIPAELRESLNQGFFTARFLGEFDLPPLSASRPSPSRNNPQDTDERENGPAEEKIAESRLVEIAPKQALERLKSVGFLPLIVLDRALRDPEIMRALSARDFELFVATLIERLGFEDVQITPQSGDMGRDILAVKREQGVPLLVAFECKQYRPDRPVGPLYCRALLGTIVHSETPADRGVLVTTSSFSPAARKFIVTEPRLEGRDFKDIVEWLLEYSRKHRRSLS